jgi:hypothetical protein
MKLSTALVLGACISLSFAAPKKTAEPVAPPKPVFTQDQAARLAITGILRDMPLDSIKPYFDDSVRANVTPENIKGFREQIGWLPQFIGDSLDLFMTGTQVVDSSGRTAFFREYRFAAESSKRAPLIIIHLYFDDSISPYIAGAYNKNFDNDTKNRIADAQVWQTPSGEVDVHSVSYVEFSEGVLPVLRIYDEGDTTTLDSALAAAKGGPAVREAIARGYLKQIKAAKPNAKHIDRFGVAFIRRNPREGYGQYTFALAPESYRDASEASKPTSGKAGGAKSKAKPATKPKAKK